MSARLHADAVRLLSQWPAPDAAAATARERTLKLLADGPAALSASHRPGHLTASVLVVNADATRVLLCLHGRFGKWVQLGGHCETSDATMADAALREATEESGIAGLILHPQPIDIDIHPVQCRAGGATLHYDVRFAGRAPAGAVEQVSEESRALGWFPPDQLPQPLAGATAHLPALALATLGMVEPL